MQTLVGEVHRRVLVEYVRAIMRGRVICTSLKMRKRVAFRLQDEAKQLKGLFKDLVSLVLIKYFFLQCKYHLQRHFLAL